MKKFLLVAILAPLAFLILLEVFLYVYLRPTETARALNTIYDWYTEVDAWGAWHLPNATALHADRCFDVEVTSNSYGARDRERSVSGKNRILVVGDSFVEGWGVEAEHRFTNVMERETGREVLNFGSNNFLGPLQYEILYRELASRFEHNLLIIGFAPHNDFTDNDVLIWKETNQGYRYRPYYSADGDSPIYLVDKPTYQGPISSRPPTIESESERKGSTKDSIKAFANEHLRSYWLFRRLKEKILANTEQHINPYYGYSGYRDFRDYQLRNVIGSFDRLVEMAEAIGARTLIVIIPAKNDLTIGETENRLTPLMIHYGEDQGVDVVDALQLGLVDSDFHSCNWLLSKSGYAKIGGASKGQISASVNA